MKVNLIAEWRTKSREDGSKDSPKGAEGVYEDNLPWVAGVEVEIRKAKRYDDRMGSRGEGEGKEKQKGWFF